MISDVVNGLRHIRMPLVTGTSALFAIWISAGDALPAKDTLDRSSVEYLAAEALDRLGTGAQIALLYLTATLIGGLLNRTVLRTPLEFVVRFLTKRKTSMEFWPTGYVASLGNLGKIAQRSSSTDVHKAIERHIHEIEFRALLGMSVGLLTITAWLSSGQPLYLLVGSATAGIALGDARLIAVQEATEVEQVLDFELRTMQLTTVIETLETW